MVLGTNTKSASFRGNIVVAEIDLNGNMTENFVRTLGYKFGECIVFARAPSPLERISIVTQPTFSLESDDKGARYSGELYGSQNAPQCRRSLQLVL